MIETLGQAQRDIKDGLDARLQLELALVKITRPQVDTSAAGLEERLRRLETGLGATRFACETAGAKAETAAGGQGRDRGAQAGERRRPGRRLPADDRRAARAEPAPPSRGRRRSGGDGSSRTRARRAAPSSPSSA